MNKFLKNVLLLISLIGDVKASQVFDLNTNTLSVPELWVGSRLYSVMLQYNPDNRLSITELNQSFPSIVGSWSSEKNLTSSKLVVITFLANGTYVFADNGNTTSNDPSGQPGIEVGTYTYNPKTGIFSSTCPTINTDLEWGLSHNRQDGIVGCSGTGATVTISANVLSMKINGESEFTLYKI